MSWNSGGPGHRGLPVYHRTRAALARRICLTLLLLCPLCAGARDLAVKKIPDDSMLRVTLRPLWFIETPAQALNSRSAIYTLRSGGRVQVRAERSAANTNEFVVVLARELNGAFPGWAQGSWALTRRVDSGEAVKIRIFPRSDPYTYIQFRPLDSNKSQMDVVVYDAYIQRSEPLSISFERLLTMPLNDILDVARDTFPFRYFEPEPDAFRDIRTFIGAVRARLPGIQFGDDGAQDENGQYVYIATLKPQTGIPGLNCSGFAKWLVDGLLKPVTGNRLDISLLKAPFGSRGSSYTDTYESQRDPFFGLDWTRNLAMASALALRSPPGGTPSGSDTGGILNELEVRSAPFVSLISRTGANAASVVRPYSGFAPDSGFGVEGLQPLLYCLAINEPGFIYLASVNVEGGTPLMRTHFHIAALIPWFDENGVFQITVFESAEETSFTALKNRYPGHNVNLVRIPVESFFDP
jgi:hypothetical protein